MRLRFTIAVLLLSTLPAAPDAIDPSVRTRHVSPRSPRKSAAAYPRRNDRPDRPRVHLVVKRAAPDPDGNGPWQTRCRRSAPSPPASRWPSRSTATSSSPRTCMQLPGQQVPYYPGNWARVCGWAMSDGVLWSAHAAPASLLVDDKGKVTIGRLGGPPTREYAADRQRDEPPGRAREERRPERAARAATAVGIDAGGKNLILHVVDGRRPNYSAGHDTFGTGRRADQARLRDRDPARRRRQHDAGHPRPANSEVPGDQPPERRAPVDHSRSASSAPSPARSA